jgi:hypothetical protein
MTYDLYEYEDFMKQNMMQLVDVRKLFPKIAVDGFWGVGALVPEPEDPLFSLDVSPLSPTFSCLFVFIATALNITVAYRIVRAFTFNFNKLKWVAIE